MRTGIVTPNFTIPPVEEPGTASALEIIARHIVQWVTVLARAIDFNESRAIITDQTLPTPTEEMRGTFRVTKETGGSGEDELYICRMGTGASLVWDKII